MRDIKSSIMLKRIGNENVIEFIDSKGEVKFVKLGDIYPYGFVEKDARSRAILSVGDDVVNYEDGYFMRKRSGEEVECYKFEVQNPSSVAELKKRFISEGLETGECDIPFWRRLCIDRTVNCNYSKDNVLYVDIEVDDSKGFPKEYGKYKILCIGAYDVDGNEYYFDIFNYSEDEMLAEFVKLMRSKCFTIVSGWNVEFDYKHILERLRELRLWDEYRYFSLCQPFDLYIKYKETIKGLSTYTLEEVSIKEGFDRPKHREKLVSLMNEDELRDYNLYDVWLCKEIDKKYGFSEVDIELSNFVNLPIHEKSPVRIGDYTVINRLRELGNYVALSARDDAEKVDYEGALVLEPVPGVHKNVIYVDVASLYPNVIIHKNIDIDGWNGEVFPYLMRQVLDMRAEKKRLYKETGEEKYNVEQQVYKIIANSLYGLLGLQYFRYYNPEKAEQVTGGGREVLMKMKRFLEEKVGAQVIYGDSVAKDSKILIRKNGEIKLVNIEELFDGEPDYIEPVTGKEYKFLDGVETITLDENGKIVWAKVPYVMRHKVDKKMYRVYVDGSYVDVTEDHSLFAVSDEMNLIEVSPREINRMINLVVLVGDGECYRYEYRRVESIEEIDYSDYVYDIEVEGTHRFFANWILVHNTDSEFVSLSNIVGNEVITKEALIEIAESIVDMINQEIHPFAVKLEDVFKKILFMKDEEGKGIKKRYVAIDYEGKYYYRGIELRRSDYCEFAKEMMSRVIDWIMKDELSRSKIDRKLKEYKIRMYKGEYDGKLIVAKSIAKEDYVVIPPHIKAYMIAKDLGYEFTDYRVKFVFIKPRNWKGETVKVWPVFDVNDVKKLRLDYEYYWEFQVLRPIKRLLSALPDDTIKTLDDFF